MALSVSLVVATSTLTYELPVAAVGYISLVVSSELDTSGRYKFIQDAAVVVDTKVLAFGKALADSATMSDSTALTVTKRPADTVTASEAFSRVVTFVRTYADTYSVTDAKVITLVKGLSDTATATDAITTFDVTKLIADGVAMNDAFDTSDGAEWAFTKGVSNIVFADDVAALQVDFVRGFDDALDGVTDSNFLDFGKSLTDNLDTGDSGSLRSQGYADFSYFAEDYVGDSRTF